MTQELINKTRNRFTAEFGAAPEHVFLSPGRINVIGEHIDYNDGYVLPAAIDRFICFTISPSGNNNCRIVALDLDDSYDFRIEDEVKPIQIMWMNYMLGVIHQFKLRNLELEGFNIAFSSNIPIGGGLSSSAALECGFGFALNEIFKFGISKKDLALIGQKAEHTFAGVMCGIMDQFASVFGKQGHVILLDCLSLEYQYHQAAFNNMSFFLIDSKVKHTHLTSGYNDRRKECEEGFKIIQRHYPAVKTFRDCTLEQVELIHDKLGHTIYKRCHFVAREIRRVLNAVEALENQDFQKLGELLYETHDGLSQEYEVSCDELDFLVAQARKEELVLGSRMMGGGFGGCTINLAQIKHQEEIIARVSLAYREQFGIEPQVYKINLSQGTHEF